MQVYPNIFLSLKYSYFHNILHYLLAFIVNDSIGGQILVDVGAW